MARPKRWKMSPLASGTATVHLSSWKYFHDFVYQEMLDHREYIWRGQRCDNWRLEPTLDRLVRRASRGRSSSAHLQRFQYAARGRRGSNPLSIATENEWWALGQHHGLATPLLDWTQSPYVAAYFAFIGRGVEQTKYRAVFALATDEVEDQSSEIAAEHDGKGRPPIVERIRPMADDNPRLVNQDGLFTRGPDGVDLESWVRGNFSGHKSSYVLIKLLIPNSDRASCLRSLNRMNINHLTLFPDLYGASKFCNLDLEIRHY